MLLGTNAADPTQPTGEAPWETYQRAAAAPPPAPADAPWLVYQHAATTGPVSVLQGPPKQPGPLEQQRYDLSVNGDRRAAASAAREAAEAPMRARILAAQATKAEADAADATAAGGANPTMDDHSMVQALIDGRMQFPTGNALRAPYWQAMLQKVSTADPTFDAVNYGARSATRRDFLSGKSAQNVRSLNTAIGHLGQLNGQIGGTASHGGFPGATLLNGVENAIDRSSGSAGITTYDQTAGALASELTQVFRGGGGAVSDIARELEHLSANGSEEQKRTAIRNIGGLLKSRLDALGDQYQQGMGTTAQPFQLLNPHAKAAYAALAGLAGDPAHPGTPPAAGGQPPAHPDGELVFDDQMPAKSASSYRLTSEQEQALQSMAMHGGTAEQMQALAHQYGGALDPDLTGQLVKYYADPSHRNVKPGFDYSRSDAIKPVDPQDGALGAGARGAADTLTLGLESKAAALAKTVTAGGTYAQNLDEVRGEQAFDEQNHPIARGVGQLVGGAFLPGFEAKGVGELAKVGFGYGAAYGGLSGDGDAGQRVAGAIGGGINGAIGGAVGGRLAELVGAGIGSRAAARATKAQDALPVIDAAERQGVPLAVPHVDPTTRARFAAVEAAPVSGGIARQALTDTGDAIERRVGEVGGGGAVDRQTLGDNLRAAGIASDQKARGKVSSAYGMAERSAAGQQVTPNAAVAALDEHIADLERTPNSSAAMLGTLRTLRNDLVEQPAAASGGGAAEAANTGSAAPIDLPRSAANVGDARRVVRGEFVGQPIKNDATGIEATVSNATLGKMTSASAMKKSASADDHLLAVANADHLFRSAQLIERYPDPRGEPTLTMSKWRALMNGADGPRGVKITVKETAHPDTPNPLYSIEAVEPDLLAPTPSGGGGIERGPGQNRYPRQAGSGPDVGAPGGPVEGPGAQVGSQAAAPSVAKPMAVDALNNLKSRVGDQLGDGLRSTDLERRLGSVYSAAKDDIGSQLTGSAARNFQRAQAMHKARMGRADVIESFIGQDGSVDAEKIVARIEAAAADKSGASDRLGKFLDLSTPEARQNLAGSLAERLGKTSADDQGFSSARFLSAIDKFSPRARAKIWGDQGAKDLADLATIARAQKGVQGSLNNSGSGRVLAWQSTLGSLLGGGSTLAAGGGTIGAGIGAAAAGAA